MEEGGKHSVVLQLLNWMKCDVNVQTAVAFKNIGHFSDLVGLQHIKVTSVRFRKMELWCSDCHKKKSEMGKNVRFDVHLPTV